MTEKFKSIFITGGAGYCGSMVVPILLEHGYKVTIYDMLFFGSNHLPLNDKNLTLIQGDIRDVKLLSK